MKHLNTTTVILAALLAVSNTAYSQAFRSQAVKFQANLTGAQEVTPTTPPGVDTATTGKIRIKFSAGLQEADFVLKVSDGVAVTAGHLHCGRAGTNGPVVVPLFEGGPVDIDGVLAEGTLTNADITPPAPTDCPVAINNIASLLAAMLDGLIYANVHTDANTSGEVRAQLFPIPLLEEEEED